MKRLIVMRHAKSDWEAGAGSDHERPLNARGRREAPTVGKRLVELRYGPELIVTSDAARTLETCELVVPSFRGVTVEREPKFYLAGIDAVRARLSEVSDEVKTILVLGHNPGWEEMASELAEERIELKTAYAAVLESKKKGRSWKELIEPGAFELAKVVKPTEG